MALRYLLVLFVLTAPAWADERWDRFPLLMWQERTAAQLRGLAALGFSGGKVRATGGVVDEAGMRALQQAGLSIYLENIATDFYAAYHRYHPDHPVTWLFDRARAAYRSGDAAAFVRTPGLDDTAPVVARLEQVVRTYAPDRPLFYNLADESGIADLAAAWDFDMSPASLAGFRSWLQGQYSDLAALNAEWGTGFAAWDAVMPEPTDAAVRRPDMNFSAWADFKAWMDVSFARAVRAGTDAVHRADPAAVAALEGGQIPGWGGYDYALLAPAVDAMEIYDAGDSLDLALAFNPGLKALRTSFAAGPREVHDAWRNVLHGGRGVVVWDETDGVVAADGAPLPRGRELAGVAASVRAVMPALLASRPDPDPVAVLHSQASFRMRWLLDRRAGDHDWAARDAEREYDDNPWRASRRVMLRQLAALGVQPRIVDGAGLARLDGVRVLLLPHAIALSDAEVAAIRTFRASGGTVLADTEPGLFDGHGRRRAVPPLPDISMPEAVRLTGEEDTPERLDALAKLLSVAGAPPRARFVGLDGRTATGIDARWRRGPDGLLLSVHGRELVGAPDAVAVQLRAGAVVSALLGTTLAPGYRLGPEPVILQIR